MCALTTFFSNVMHSVFLRSYEQGIDLLMREPGVAELEYCRSVLLRAVKDLCTKQLDFLIFPDSKSIGEILLHIAGFEFLMISVSAFKHGRNPDYDLWRILKPGFSREAGFLPPREYTLKHYLDVLSEVRGWTIRHFSQDLEHRMASKEGFPISELTGILGDNDTDDDQHSYDRLSSGVGTSFEDDGAENEVGKIDITSLLRLHETYHRGQITLQKYVYSRINAGNQ
jgi:hypothetical protein